MELGIRLAGGEEYDENINYEEEVDLYPEVHLTGGPLEKGTLYGEKL